MGELEGEGAAPFLNNLIETILRNELLFWILLPLIVVGVIVVWALETDSDRAKRWLRSGMSKAEISRRLEVTRYRVNKLLV